MPTTAKKRLHWVALLFIPSYHLALIIALPVYLMHERPSAALLWLTAGLWVATLMSITTGYHRLYSHATYKTNRVAELVFLFFATVAGQGSALRWSHDHRIHHRHVDTDQDPYGTPKGFWHSHVLWMFLPPPAWRPRLVRDLLANPLVAFQHRHYGLLFAGSNLLIVLAAGLALGDLAGSFVFLFLLRLAVAHHCTWFINSIAHIWGSKPFSTEHSAVNNFLIALLTFGEGYHNYHHTFAGDYRNGVRWYQFDPPKYLIWLMSKLGLARDLRRINALTIRRRLLLADRKLLLDHLERVVLSETRQWAERIEQASQALNERIAALGATTERYRRLKQGLEGQAEEELAALKARVAACKKSLAQEMQSWKALCEEVLRLEAAPA